jgi:hypothetical protein
MEAEDTVRSKMGLVLCLRDMGNGTSRLFFDDVQADSVTCPAAWRPDCFYTVSPDLPNAALEGMALSDSQYQDIGVAVVARLLALNERVK